MSTDTNVGPREGAKSLTQLFDSGGGAFTLPATGTLNKVISVEQKRKLTHKVIYKNLCRETEVLGFAYETNMNENSLSLLEENAVPDSITSTLINLCRQLDAKGKEWLTWNVVLRGTDKDNQDVPGSGTVVEFGRDFHAQVKQLRDANGTVTRLQLGNKTTPYYTTEYSQEKLQSLLSGQEYELDRKLSLTVAEANGRSWSGMSQLEFESLPSKELIWRCKNNHVNEDIDISFSTMPTAQKLNLSLKQ